MYLVVCVFQLFGLMSGRTMFHPLLNLLRTFVRLFVHRPSSIGMGGVRSHGRWEYHSLIYPSIHRSIVLSLDITCHSVATVLLSLAMSQGWNPSCLWYIFGFLGWVLVGVWVSERANTPKASCPVYPKHGLGGWWERVVGDTRKSIEHLFCRVFSIPVLIFSSLSFLSPRQDTMYSPSPTSPLSRSSSSLASTGSLRERLYYARMLDDDEEYDGNAGGNRTRGDGDNDGNDNDDRDDDNGDGDSWDSSSYSTSSSSSCHRMDRYDLEWELEKRKFLGNVRALVPALFRLVGAVLASRGRC